MACRRALYRGAKRQGWAHPINADTFAGAIQLADYLTDHAQAVFDLMGADPRTDDARWLLDWISRTNQAQFSRRDAHQAARGRFRKATDLEPPLTLLEEHGWLRRVDPETPPRPPGPWPTPLPPVPCQPPAPILRNHRNHKNPRQIRFCGFCGF
jgi:hypothetical protein